MKLRTGLIALVAVTAAGFFCAAAQAQELPPNPAPTEAEIDQMVYDIEVNCSGNTACINTQLQEMHEGMISVSNAWAELYDLCIEAIGGQLYCLPFHGYMIAWSFAAQYLYWEYMM